MCTPPIQECTLICLLAFVTCFQGRFPLGGRKCHYNFLSEAWEGKPHMIIPIFILFIQFPHPDRFWLYIYFQLKNNIF